MTLRQTQFVAPVPLVVAEEHGLIEAEGSSLDIVRTPSSAEHLRQLGRVS